MAGWKIHSELKDSIWIGFWNGEFEEEENNRIYCCIQVYSSKDLGALAKKVPDFRKPNRKNDFTGIMNYKPLISIIGNKKKEQHQDELNNFFRDNLRKLEESNVWDTLST